MLNHQGKGSMFSVRREFSARKSNRLMLIVLGMLLVGHVLATGANAATFRESQDSFGNIARPYRAGTLAPGVSNSYVGSLNPNGGDQNDVIQFTLSRTATVTIVPSRALDMSVYQGYRLLARNNPRFGSIQIRLPAGSYNLSVGALSFGRTSYSVGIQVR
jgi:hypothetical protein